MARETHYFFEVYTRNPKTLEGGWDIKCGFVLRCDSRDEAVRRIETRFGRLFDAVIQCYEAALAPIGGVPTIIRD